MLFASRRTNLSHLHREKERNAEGYYVVFEARLQSISQSEYHRVSRVDVTL